MTRPRPAHVRLALAALALLTPLSVLTSCGGETADPLAPPVSPSTPTYTYTISPSSGPAGTRITIYSPTDFVSVYPYAVFNGTSEVRTQSGTSPHTVFATAPAGSGRVGVQLQAPPDGYASVGDFTYVTPYAYVVNQGNNTVTEYSYNPSTGALTALGTVPTGANPIGITMSPDSQYAYVVNQGAANISEYSVDPATGLLTSAGTVQTGPAAPNPDCIALTSDGLYAYVSDQTNNTLCAYTVTSGTLSGSPTIAPAPDSAGHPAGIAFSADGHYAYAANQASTTVSEYSVNNGTGTLTPLGTVGAGNHPVGVALSNDGRFAYVTNNGDNTVSQYTVNSSTGGLTATGTPVATGANPAGIALSADGHYAYVCDQGSNTISEYTVNATTGALAPFGTVTTGSNPNGIVFTP